MSEFCPKCKHEMNRNGKPDGRQRWRCVKSSGGCGHSFTENALDPWRPSIGDQAMTNNERQKRFQANKKTSENS